jgi:peptidoglycan/LPS O-acetylase OafA/YrhL
MRVTVIVAILGLVALLSMASAVLTLGFIGIDSAVMSLGFIGVILAVDDMRRETAAQGKLSQDLAIRLHGSK